MDANLALAYVELGGTLLIEAAVLIVVALVMRARRHG